MNTTLNTPAAWSTRASSATPWDAACWTETGQSQRFLAVLKHLDLRDGDSLLDFGCGPARLSAFLPSQVDYFGYDPAVGMRDRAAVDHPAATILASLPDMLFDHVVAVGPFNLPDGWSHDQTFGVLGDLWTNHVRRTLIVSLYRGTDVRCLIYDPVTVTDWAKRLGAHRFLIDASYLDNDLLLVLRR